MRKQIHVYYTGRVQGVGFRFTAQDLANEKGIFGWAKNLRDGRVEIRAEAEEKVLKDLRWRAKKNENYYYMGNNGKSCNSNDYYSTIDNDRFEIGNYHQTEEQCEEYAKKMIEFSKSLIK